MWFSKCLFNEVLCFLLFCLSVCLSVTLSIISVCLSVCLFLCLSVGHSLYHLCLSVCLSLSLSVSLSLSSSSSSPDIAILVGLVYKKKRQKKVMYLLTLSVVFKLYVCSSFLLQSKAILCTCCSLIYVYISHLMFTVI